MSGALVAEGLHHRYGRRGPDVLAGVDWTIAPGSRTVLLGPPGSGKSTLLGLLAGASAPRRGRVYLDGGGDVRRAVGRLPQSPAAVPGLSVSEHVAYVAWLKGRPRGAGSAGEWLDAAGLAGRAGHAAAALTPVERPRLALAEALAFGARFLVLDAPTDTMEPHDREKFWTLLLALPRTLAIVVSSTLPNTAVRPVDAVAVLAGGALRFTGTREEFLGRGAEAASAEPVRRRQQGREKRSAAAAYRGLVG